MKNNENKVVLLTGASSGIGKTTTIKLLEEGYTVYAAARRIEKMANLKSLGAHVIALDVTDEQSMFNAVNQIVNDQGRLDILINNAGYGSYGAVEDVSMQEAKRQFEVNIFGLARLTQLALPHMRKFKYGKIINISSIGGKIYTPLGAWYHGTKHALEGFSDCLRMEVEPHGIDVVIVEPGAIKTEWTQIAINSMKETSGDGAYANITGKVSKVFEKEDTAGSSPEVIAKVILKALCAKKPKTRYTAGKYSFITLFMRKILSDRMFDKLLLSQAK